MEISPSLMSVGVQTIKASQQQLASTAQTVANATVSDMPMANIADLTQQLVQMDQAQHLAMVGGKMVEAASENIGTLLNTMG
ncbi:MAG: hypothetical protein QMB92_04765 [Thiopseudomonas sp.]|nr:hypothetical protein [Gammaproteobacteria bacterium]